MLRLSRAEIDLWLVVCHAIADAALLERYRALMSVAEREQEKRFRTARLRKRFLLTRALVRTVLSRYADVAPHDWRFTPDRFGRPCISNPTDEARSISFNIAHTDELVLLGVTTRSALGVDIESVRSRTPVAQLAQRYFSSAESSELHALALPQQRERFCALWTLKESYVKARGQGLSIPLRLISFAIRNAEIAVRMEPDLGDDPRRWNLWLLRPSGTAGNDSSDMPSHVMRSHVMRSHLMPSHPMGGHGAHFAAVCAESADGALQRLVMRHIVPLVTDWPVPSGEVARSVQPKPADFAACRTE